MQKPDPETESDEPQEKTRGHLLSVESQEAAHDRDLIRSSLTLDPEERLAVLQDFVDTFWTPQHG